jgi:hypothetical protein
MILAHLGAGRLVARGLFPREAGSAFLAAACGLGLSHALALLGLPFGWILALLGAAAVASIVPARAREGLAVGARDVLVLCLLSLPLWAYCIGKALWAFDPRSFWFFQGKIMFLTGRFTLDVWPTLRDHLAADYILLTHPDYPKLVGVLAAETATLAGYWNEYLPKIAILVLDLAALLGLGALRGRWFARGLIVAGLVPPFRYLLSSGYPDIYLALFLTIAFGFACRYARARQATDLVTALAALALCPQLKNEGGVLALLMLVWPVLLGVWSPRELLRHAKAALLFAPVVIWAVEKKLMHLTVDLAAGYSSARTMERVTSAADRWLIFRNVFLTSWSLVAAAALAVSFGVNLARRRAELGAPRPERTILRLGLAVTASYAAILCFVYVSSPWPSLKAHLDSSISRVTIPLAFVALWTALECVWGARAPVAAPRPAVPR